MRVARSWTPTIPRSRAVGRLGTALLVLSGAGLIGVVPAAAASHRPVGGIEDAEQGLGGIHLAGWAIDPSVTSAIDVQITMDGALVRTVKADQPDPAPVAEDPSAGPNHGFDTTLPAGSGAHDVCLEAMNVNAAGAASGTGTNLGCYAIHVRVSPVGALSPIARPVGSRRIKVVGWAADPQTDQPVSVAITIDKVLVATVKADRKSRRLRMPMPGFGLRHKFRETYRVNARAHTVCVTALDIGRGKDKSIGCQTSPVLPIPPSAPRSVTATALELAAQVSWAAPANTGRPGLPRYVVTSSPTGPTATVSGHRLTATVPGLRAGVPYRFTVRAVNAAGSSPPAAASKRVVPAAISRSSGSQPALISTSRYIRNISGAASDTAKTFAMGASDGAHNPAQHKYLTLLQIGGQTTTGIILSATSTYVSYAEAVTALKAYLDGYASTQRTDAPAMIAIGTNNDTDVRRKTGEIWATQMVHPLRRYARRYDHMKIVGANDIEPGFLGSPHETKGWLRGYLGATAAKVVFNGSADGCGWTSAASRCNNGWTASTMQWLSGGAAPTRILSLPQIYNSTMPKQWKYISLTGVGKFLPKIKFVGPLTEWTACYTQHGGCGSLSNNSAWLALWAQLNTDSRVAQSSLPYGTDLRIN